MAISENRRVTDGGKVLCSGLRGDLARLLYARNGRRQVVIVGESRLDQVRQCLVPKDTPPGLGGEGGLLCCPGSAPESRRGAYIRPFIVRADGATRQNQERGR